ncbi:MAG TPA: TetR/AcrR family transcriptional regulator [Acidimicrobiia bacterium]|nr:TetR/AcrR family transcriptional regulator [Acidimicrobiia bacterium]
MSRTLTKGAQTRQRIVELAAPVFNKFGYVGASMRDLVDATGLEKGGIYNHFGSKEQLALEAYDHAMNLVENSLARSQHDEDDAIERLQAMIRTFARGYRNPVVAGGCPIMNTAIEADDTQPDLRDRARASMNRWHRMIGRIVKDGKAAGTVRADVDPYDVAALCTAALEGGLMLSRLFEDASYIDRVVEQLVSQVADLRVSPQEETA